MKKKFNLIRGSVFIASLLVAASSATGVIMEANRNEIDGFFGTHSKVVVTQDDGTLYDTYTPDAKYLKEDGKGNAKAIVDDHVALNTQMQEEGSVLLKNKNNVLPLKAASDTSKPKITLLGIRSHVILAGSGMGVTANAGEVVQLETALAKDFDVNPTMSSIYETLNGSKKLTNNDKVRPGGFGPSTVPDNGFNPNEPSLTELSDVNGGYQSSFSEYGDAAVVVVGRPSNESSDYGVDHVDPEAGLTQPLALSTNEREIIKLATEKFSKVVVLVNTNSPMEIEELKQNDKVSSILWIGHTGCYGTYGISNILAGKANPSGHLYDIYSSDSLSSPAMMNTGNFVFANPEGEITRTPSNGSSNKYVIEAEGIYTGYKYYETRYEDVVLKQGNAASEVGTYRSEGAWNYDKEVSYGFGYGLSYTNFTQKIDKVNIHIGAHEIYADVKVTITNHGEVAGKDVVQVYGQAPYTRGGIEKASIQLLNFEKTEILAPKASTTLTVRADLQNLASWDSNAMDGKGSYVLENGDYYFAIGNGAHDALNNVLAAKGKTTADGMTDAGNADLASKWNYKFTGGKVDQTTFNVSKAGTTVHNALSEADWNTWDAGKVTYLSRSAWDTTYPKTYSDMVAPASMLKTLNGGIYEAKTGDDMSDAILNAANGLRFADLKGADFDDPRWQTLLDQLDLTEALNFILCGNRTLPAMESVGFLGGRFTENGPNGIGGRGFGTLSYNNYGETVPEWMISETDENGGFGMNVFPSAPLVASTFNPEIAYEQGRLIGNDALFVGLPILWGPGLNTHRNPYNGRSGEYYSEDPIITGVMGMEFAVGALEKGLIAAPKHYAFNDQETNRAGIAPFMTEQRARETELRAFQLAFEASKYDTEDKDIGMLGVMTSFSKIGPTEVTCSSGMLNEILRTEWGFKGYIVSDMNDDTDIMADAIMAGLSSFDASGTIDALKINPFTADKYSSDATFVKAVKEAVHYDLYVMANSNYANTMATSSYTEERMVSWRVAYVTAIAVSAALTLGTAAIYAVVAIKSKKEHN